LFRENRKMESKEPPDEPHVSPTEVWDNLTPQQRARAVRLLTQIAYKFITTKLTASGGKADTSLTNGTSDSSSLTIPEAPSEES
jgi:hypothetical protein